MPDPTNPSMDHFGLVGSGLRVASFPGPAQLSVASSTESLGTRLVCKTKGAFVNAGGVVCFKDLSLNASPTMIPVFQVILTNCASQTLSVP